MKFYFNEEECKFINARKLVGMEEHIEDLGYVDFLGKGQYNFQLFHVLVVKTDEGHKVTKTVSDNKKNGYLLQGWTLVSEKGSNEILPEYLQEEVIVNE